MSDLSFKRRVIKVQGVSIKIEPEEYIINDIDDTQRKVSKQMAFWSSVWGAAVEEQIKADAFYRAWRADRTEALLKEDPKISEWKVKAKIEADPLFLKMKQAIAIASDNVTTSEHIWKTLDKRGNLSQSLGAKTRKEIAKQDLSTRVESDEESPLEEERRERMKKILKKGEK